MYEVFVLRPIGSHNQFVPAFQQFIRNIDEMIKNREMSLQCLETMCWIERDAHTKSPAMFYEVRNFGCDQGLLIEGELAEPAPTIDEATIAKFYQKLVATYSKRDILHAFTMLCSAVKGAETLATTK